MAEPARQRGVGPLPSELRPSSAGPDDVIELVDSLLSDRALVFGSLPPQGRDLDLLVSPTDADRLNAGLAERGFLSAAGKLARFRDCTVDVVDLVSSETWDIPELERVALFAEARPLPGTSRLALPAPHHVLLILARRISRGGVLTERRLARVDAALGEDSGAFERARERAGDWGIPESLAVLETAHRERRDPNRTERLRAMSEGPRGPGRPQRWIRRARRRLTAPLKGIVVTFSGLDGSGKSSQGEYLRATLERLGYDAVLVWEPIANTPGWLRASVRVVRAPLVALHRVSGWLRGRRGDSSVAGPDADREPPPGFAWATDHPATVLRRRSVLLTFGWSLVITLQFGYRLARATWPQLVRGGVVICDRYTLDSWVYLLYKFGDQRSYALQFAILRSVSPRPRLAYFLDVPGDVASMRKTDFRPERNERRARLYRSRAAELGVRRIDGELPPDRIAAQVAEEVWRTLQSSR